MAGRSTPGFDVPALPMTSTSTWLAGVTLAPPSPEWADRSMLVFAAPPGTGDPLPANVSIARDERRAPTDPVDEPLVAYARRQLQTLTNALPEFRLQRQGRLGEAQPEVRELVFSWRSGAVPLTQWLVWTALPDGSVVNFTATAASARFAEHLPMFEQALHSLRLDPARIPPPAPR